MKKISLLTVLSCSFLLSCTPQNIVTISKTPVFPGDAIPLKELSNELEQQVVRIGELNELNNLDPLLATSNGEKRIINLVFDGLTQLDESGTIQPSIAEKWEISSDSLTYTFHLGNKYFHPSGLFVNGTGREVSSDDIRFTFERMATNKVPAQAARRFGAISGMDLLFAQEHEIYDPTKRVIRNLSGISTPDDKTVVFKLDFKDSDFLRNLARPEASIYPKEALNTKGYDLNKNPIGTGDWLFSGVFQDSIITLRPVKQSTNISKEIKRKRVEFYFYKSEVSLYKQFFSDEIDVIPELGPQLANAILTNDGSLSPSYQDQFSLFKSVSSTPYTLFLNTENSFHISQAEALIILSKERIEQLFSGSKFIEKFDFKLSETTYKANQEVLNRFIRNSGNQALTFFFDSDMISFEILRTLSQSVSSNYASQLVNLPVTGRNTIFYMSGNQNPPHDGFIKVATFYTQRTGLQKYDKKYADFSNELWWIHIDTE